MALVNVAGAEGIDSVVLEVKMENAVGSGVDGVGAKALPGCQMAVHGLIDDISVSKSSLQHAHAPAHNDPFVSVGLWPEGPQVVVVVADIDSLSTVMAGEIGNVAAVIVGVVVVAGNKVGSAGVEPGPVVAVMGSLLLLSV